MSARIPPLTPAELVAQCARIDGLIDHAQAHQLELRLKAAQRRTLDRGNRSVPQPLGPTLKKPETT
jgi:hypothetical protein